MKDTPNISWTWEEGRYWDLWMFVHLVWGVIAACLAVLAQFDSLFSYIAVLFIMMTWECAEIVLGVMETKSNLLLDIVFGFAAFVVAYEYVLPPLARDIQAYTLIILLIAAAALEFFGWRAYRKRVTT